MVAAVEWVSYRHRIRNGRVDDPMAVLLTTRDKKERVNKSQQWRSQLLMLVPMVIRSAFIKLNDVRVKFVNLWDWRRGARGPKRERTRCWSSSLPCTYTLSIRSAADSVEQTQPDSALAAGSMPEDSRKRNEYKRIRVSALLSFAHGFLHVIPPIGWQELKSSLEEQRVSKTSSTALRAVFTSEAILSFSSLQAP